jgi:hypothetical protein
MEATMQPSEWVSLFSNLPAIIGAVTALIAMIYGIKNSNQIAAAAVKTDDNHKQQVGAIKSLAIQTDAIEARVNGAVTTNLRLVSESARKTADVTCSKGDIALADAAELALKNHLADQETSRPDAKILPKGP